MIKTVDAKSYIEMLENGIKNIRKNKQSLNDLNVFPVPDGDTGTNMFMTLKYGLDNCNKQSKSVSKIADDFASLAVFGARGNSGVILSQFFKGIAEGLKGKTNVSPADLICSLEKGCYFAYHAVAKPVEGTMLTVIREATDSVKANTFSDVESLVESFVENAKISLEKTPNLLPILKKAGVVDSGGSGIVCFFDGVLKGLKGASIEEDDVEEDVDVKASIDFSLINKDTPLTFGYCVEGLIQLKFDESDFDLAEFKKDLSKIGNSVVASLEKDKIKLHVHTKKLYKVMEYCQKYGEFLTIKIENMSVQNLAKKQEEVQKFLVSEEKGENFNVVAVASNPYLQKKFIEMGADVVILSQITPSSQDFLDAFSYLDKGIIVFPNSANSILAAVQAGGLCKGKKIHVINSRSAADCYGALSVMDFDGEVDDVVIAANEAINATFKAFCYHSVKDIKFGDVAVRKNDFFALVGNQKILCVAETLDKVVLRTVKDTVEKKNATILTIFYADGIAEEYVNYLCQKIDELGLDLEVAAVCTMENVYSLALSFE